MDPSCSLAQARSAGAGKPSYVDNAIKARGHYFKQKCKTVHGFIGFNSH